MIEYNISFKNLIEGFEAHKEMIINIEKDFIASDPFNSDKNTLFAQVGALRVLFEIISDRYFEDRNDFPNAEIIQKWKSKMNTHNNSPETNRV